MKCRYSHCRHESREIKDGDAVTENGKTYYHKDCMREKKMIDAIIGIYADRVEKDPDYSQLRRIINCLLYKRNVNVDFLYFAVSYATERGYLHHPAGLYHIVKSEDIIKEWKKRSVVKMINDYSPKDSVTTYTYIPSKKKNLEDIFG